MTITCPNLCLAGSLGMSGSRSDDLPQAHVRLHNNEGHVASSPSADSTSFGLKVCANIEQKSTSRRTRAKTSTLTFYRAVSLVWRPRNQDPKNESYATKGSDNVTSLPFFSPASVNTHTHSASNGAEEHSKKGRQQLNNWGLFPFGVKTSYSFQ
eukprot:2190630-Amphidinium_carterae.1